jgi:hypothetical protein
MGILAASGILAMIGILAVASVLAVDVVPAAAGVRTAPTAVRAGFLAVLAGVPDMDSIPHCCSFLLPFSGVPVPAVAG